MPSLRRAGWTFPRFSLAASRPLHRARLALLAGAIVCASVIGLAAINLWYEHSADLRHAERDLVNLGHALGEHLVQRLDNIDLALKAALSQLHDQPLAAPQIARILRAHADTLTLVQAIGLYGPQGELIAASSPDAHLLPPSIAGRTALTSHRSGQPSALHIAAPMRFAADGPWHILLSRPVRDAQGEFRGVIAATFDPRRLVESYRAMDLGAETAIALVDRQGTLLAIYPWRDDSIARPLVEPAKTPSASGRAAAEAGFTTSAIDDGRLLAADTALRGFPLTLTVMAPRQAVLASWRRHAAVGGTAAVLTGVLALALGALLDRHVRRREESVVRLREQRAELTEAQRIARLGSWHLEADGSRLRWSPEAAAMLGTPADTVPTLERLLTLVHEEDRPAVERAWRDLPGTGTLDVEFQTASLGDASRWLRARAEIVREARKRGFGARGTLVDVTEERRAQQAVQHLAAIVESTEDAILSISEDGRILSWNSGATRMFAFSAGQTIGRLLSELLPTRQAAQAQQLVARSARGETIEGFETRLVLPDKRMIHIAVTLSPLRDDTGRITAASAVARDITGRREAERRRQMEHRIAQLLAESAPLQSTMPRILEVLCRSAGLDCGLQWDIDAETSSHRLAFLWCRPGWHLAALWSQVGSQMPAPGEYDLPWHTSLPQWLAFEEINARQPWLNRCGKSFATALVIPISVGTRVVSVLELLATRPRARDLELLASAQVIASQIGQFIERKRVEAAQRQADERLRNIAANIPGIVFEYRLRPDGTAAFEFVSERSMDLLEERPDALMADPRSMFKLVEPEYRRQLLRSMRVSRNSRSLWLAEMPIRTASGRVRWVRGQSMPKYFDDGSVVWDGVIVDVTAQKQAEQAIQQMNEQLERRVAERTAQLSAANRELESFAYSVSHDLRAPLRSIDGFSRILAEEYGNTLEPTAADYLTRVRNAAERMGKLFDDLLSLSRVTRSELKRVRTDLSAIAEAIMQELRADCPERTIDVSIHPGMFCLADPSLIRIALYNLLGNAWKFTSRRAAASIEFGALSQRSKTVFYVRDNGAGFDMAHAGKLFGAFQRLHSPREFEGTGVGLATVSRIIDRHGGTVWAESVPDKGATFYFTLGSGSRQ